MNEYEALRREIEVRLMRQTIYRAVEALNYKTSLTEDIKKNEEIIALIGKFLLDKGSEWEKVYKEKYG